MYTLVYFKAKYGCLCHRNKDLDNSKFMFIGVTNRLKFILTKQNFINSNIFKNTLVGGKQNRGKKKDIHRCFDWDHPL